MIDFKELPDEVLQLFVDIKLLQDAVIEKGQTAAE